MEKALEIYNKLHKENSSQVNTFIKDRKIDSFFPQH